MAFTERGLTSIVSAKWERVTKTSLWLIRCLWVIDETHLELSKVTAGLIEPGGVNRNTLGACQPERIQLNLAGSAVSMKQHQH